MKARIALHYHIPFSVNGGKLYCPSYYGVWVESLAEKFDEVIVIAYTCELRAESYLISSSNVHLLDLGQKPKTLFNRILQFKNQRKLISDRLDTFDCVGIRAPTPLAIFIYWVVRQKPVFFLLVGNLWRMLQFSDLVLWKKVLLTLYWKLDHLLLSLAGNCSVVFVNGNYFFREFPMIKDMNIMFTSTIYKKDIVENPKIYNRSNRLKLIFVGRVEPDKGVEYVIQAMGHLKKSGVEVEFAILGTVSEAEKSRLLSIAGFSQVAELVSFTGYVPHGDNFREYLSLSDVMIIPSVWDFQTRAVWEGMSRALPIIASRGIKSLPLQFKHKEEIYFVDPCNAEELVFAINDLIKDQQLYAALSNASIRIAHERTVERSANLLLDQLRNSDKFRSVSL